MSSVPVFICSSLNWHHWMWLIKQHWFGKVFDFCMNLYIQTYQLASRVLFMLIISVSFQHGFQGDIYQKLNIFCFSCHQDAAAISVSNVVPVAVVVCLCCPSCPSLHIFCLVFVEYLCINVIWTYRKLTWDVQHFCSCFDSTDSINILHDRIFFVWLLWILVAYMNIWKPYYWGDGKVFSGTPHSRVLRDKSIVEGGIASTVQIVRGDIFKRENWLFNCFRLSLLM